jgi:hypothetical protein
MIERSSPVIDSYMAASVICGSRGREESIRRGAEGPASGSLIFSRMEMSCWVRDEQAMLDDEMLVKADLKVDKWE